MKVENIKYIKFTPGGNNTALVINDNYKKDEKLIINDYILGFDKSIEQVGFISKDEYRLDMAGGEFCGNATRSATKYYLNNNQGNIKINVNGKYLLNSGIDKYGLVFCEMPIIKDYNQIENINNKYIVRLDGIVFIIVEELINIKDKELKEYSFNLIKQYKLNKNEAAGVIYLNNNKIIPVIYVKNINTLFIETACGSGTAAVGIYKSFITKKSIEEDIIQPSGKIITVKTNYDDFVNYVEIKGIVESNLKLRKIK